MKVEYLSLRTKKFAPLGGSSTIAKDGVLGQELVELGD
jgi:hypothetical protein